MRLIFEQSEETAKLVALFKEIPIGKEVSFSDASEIVGFEVTSDLSAYQSAKRAAERDHKVVIEGIRGFGFKRIDGAGMVERASRFFKHVRKGSRREANVQEIAISQNLTRGQSIRATEQLSRLRIMETTAAQANRYQEPKPDGRNEVKIDNREALKSLLSK
jgi:hypothetical protein